MNNIPVLISLKQARDKRHYKNKEIAEAVKVSESMVSLIIQNKINIGGMKLETAYAFADWLECGIDDLIGRVPSDKPQN